jgi:excisionase family DNA binding protein
VAGISYRDVHGIADELGVDVQTVRRWIQSGKLRAFKPGKEYRVREADLEEFLAAREVRPKGPAPSPLEPSLLNGLEEERRLRYLKPWAGYVRALANRVDRRIEQGHAKDLGWWQEFNTNVLTLTLLYNRILPPPAEQSEDERLELLKFGEAIDHLNDVADKMDKAMEPVVAKMHKDRYEKERERRKAAFKAIPARRSA